MTTLFPDLNLCIPVISYIIFSFVFGLAVMAVWAYLIQPMLNKYNPDKYVLKIIYDESVLNNNTNDKHIGYGNMEKTLAPAIHPTHPQQNVKGYDAFRNIYQKYLNKYEELKRKIKKVEYSSFLEEKWNELWHKVIPDIEKYCQEFDKRYKAVNLVHEVESIPLNQSFGLPRLESGSKDSPNPGKIVQLHSKVHDLPQLLLPFKIKKIIPTDARIFNKDVNRLTVITEEYHWTITVSDDACHFDIYQSEGKIEVSWHTIPSEDEYNQLLDTWIKFDIVTDIPDPISPEKSFVRQWICKIGQLGDHG